jgi:2-methylcitrate dehydratase PrpD
LKITIESIENNRKVKITLDYNGAVYAETWERKPLGYASARSLESQLEEKHKDFVDNNSSAERWFENFFKILRTLPSGEIIELLEDEPSEIK